MFRSWFVCVSLVLEFQIPLLFRRPFCHIMSFLQGPTRHPQEVDYSLSLSYNFIMLRKVGVGSTFEQPEECFIAPVACYVSYKAEPAVGQNRFLGEPIRKRTIDQMCFWGVWPIASLAHAGEADWLVQRTTSKSRVPCCKESKSGEHRYPFHL